MKQQTLTITTDFGDSFASSQLRAVATALGYEGRIIENHDVEKFCVQEGAYGIWQLAKYCPEGTVHVGVVDPGVGSKRAGLIIKSGGQWFVGPDNGLLSWIAEKGDTKIWRIDERWFGKVSKTFHGRDVFVKGGVMLLEGKSPEEFGCREFGGQITRLKFENGQILHLDHYGNAKFYWDKRVEIGQRLFGIEVVETFSDKGAGEAIILNGSSELLELAVNLGSAKNKYGLKLGQIISESTLNE